MDLLKAVPTVWDETLVLPCTEMGEVVAYARRKGKEWWIGVMNGDKEREIEIPLDFLKKKKQAVFLHDGKELASVVREERGAESEVAGWRRIRRTVLLKCPLFGEEPEGGHGR